MMSIDFDDLKALHADGHHETAWFQFAQVCREALYGEHSLPDAVSHLVHYTTLETLMSMLGVVEAPDEDYPLAAHSQEIVEQHDGSLGYLRLYDTFSSNDPNEGSFFVSAADNTESFRQSYRAVWSLFENRSAAPAYQASVTYVGDAAEADKLVFWRTYGKEGAGCALAFPIACFKEQGNLFRVRVR